MSVGFWEAWIGLNRGVPELMTWQTQCNGATVYALPANQCGSAQCVQNFCGLNTQRCVSQPSLCDATLYVAWRGADAKNQLCQSFGRLPSNFFLFSSQSVISYLTQGVSDFVYGVLNSASIRAPTLFLIVTLLGSILTL